MNLSGVIKITNLARLQDLAAEAPCLDYEIHMVFPMEPLWIVLARYSIRLASLSVRQVPQNVLHTSAECLPGRNGLAERVFCGVPGLLDGGGRLLPLSCFTVQFRH